MSLYRRIHGNNPWWIPSFLGRVPSEMPARHVSLLGALAVAIYFENYDQALLTQAIKQIAASFDVAEQEIGSLLGWVRLGAIPALLLVPLADRLGRRRLFLVSLVGMSLSSGLSAFAPGVGSFLGLQMLARAFMVTCSATAFVIVSEEIAASERGWGIGILGGIGALGVGLAAGLFALIEYLPFGWRSMYGVALAPLALLPALRRRVGESARFERHRNASATGANLIRGWWQPLVELVRDLPGRALAIGVIAAGSAGGHAAAYNFSAYFVQTDHGWAPAQYSVMLLLAGGVGIIGHPATGRLADRHGRRRVGFALFAAFPVLSLAFYRGPGWMLPLAWIPMIFALTGGNTIARALATELFPTSHRGTATGFMLMAEALGAGAGLFAVSWLTPEGGSVIPAVQLTSLLTVPAALTILLLPETGRRELEAISGR